MQTLMVFGLGFAPIAIDTTGGRIGSVMAAAIMLAVLKGLGVIP